MKLNKCHEFVGENKNNFNNEKFRIKNKEEMTFEKVTHSPGLSLPASKVTKIFNPKQQNVTFIYTISH